MTSFSRVLGIWWLIDQMSSLSLVVAEGFSCSFVPKRWRPIRCSQPHTGPGHSGAMPGFQKEGSIVLCGNPFPLLLLQPPGATCCHPSSENTPCFIDNIQHITSNSRSGSSLQPLVAIPVLSRALRSQTVAFWTSSLTAPSTLLIPLFWTSLPPWTKGPWTLAFKSTLPLSTLTLFPLDSAYAHFSPSSWDLPYLANLIS